MALDQKPQLPPSTDDQRDDSTVTAYSMDPRRPRRLLAGGATTKHVTEAPTKMISYGDAAVGAAEHRRRGLLRYSQAGPVLDALAGGAQRFTGDETAVTPSLSAF